MEIKTREEAIRKVLDTGRVPEITWEKYQEALKLTDPWEIHDFWINVCSHDSPGWNGEEREPVTIPEDYGEGKTLELQDGTLETSTYTDRCRLGEYEGRLISIEIGNFPGHPHYYANVDAGCVSWVDAKNCTHGGHIPTKSGEKAPNLPKLEWEIHRIVPAEEILTQVHLWDQFERERVKDGEIVWSTRFLSRVELVFTGIFTCLARIEGPFKLYLGSRWSKNEEKLMCTVDRVGKVFIADWLYLD